MSISRKLLIVVGLGYVGLPVAVAFSRTHRVIGYDIDSNRVLALREGMDRTLEVSREELREAKNLEYVSNPEALKNYREKYAEGAVFIVTVPTPVDPMNKPDFRPLVQASELVGNILQRGDLVVYESTVFPGATEEICIPILEKNSGMLCESDSNDQEEPGPGDGSTFAVGYSPERINPGDSQKKLSNIKKLVSGTTKKSTDELYELYSLIVHAGVHRTSSIRVAEAAKVIENAQRDINIAFVNELSLIFDRVGIDTSEVLEAAGTKWNFLSFKPGLVGGHCIGVDPFYLAQKAQSLGYQPKVILAGRRLNDGMAKHAAKKTIRLMKNSGLRISDVKVGVFGVTFKEDCPDVRNSKVFDLISELKKIGANIHIHDPIADPRQVYDEYGVEISNDLMNFPKLDVLVICVAHGQYRKLEITQLRGLFGRNVKNPIISDLKSIFNKKLLIESGFLVYRM